MLDIETLGNSSNAAIVQIAACFFDIETGDIGAEFDILVDIQDSAAYGAIDPSTIKWWFGQSEQAQKVITDGFTQLEHALHEFKDFLYGDEESTSKIQVWGNGSGFDNVILANAYKALKMPVPWKHWNDRDVRTIVELGRSIKNVDPKKYMPFDGTPHNALDDAKHQAKYVSEIYRALSGINQ